MFGVKNVILRCFCGKLCSAQEKSAIFYRAKIMIFCKVTLFFVSCYVNEQAVGGNSM